MDHARNSGMFIVGGSIPERDGEKIYNTCLVVDPRGKVVAKHRKVHLFDIDVPGGITFRESDTLSPGETMTAFDGGSVFGMVGVGIWYVGRERHT
jgi:omega-amidase